MSLINRLFSTAKPTGPKNSAVVGASKIGTDPYDYYASTLAWIKDTQNKMPGGTVFEITAEMREQAYNVDPLLSGTIIVFLKNIVLSSYHIETADNKKYEAAIKDINSWLEEIGLMTA